MPGPSAPGVGLPAHHEGAQGRTADRAAYPLTVALLLRRLFRHLSALYFRPIKDEGHRPQAGNGRLIRNREVLPKKIRGSAYSRNRERAK